MQPLRKWVALGVLGLLATAVPAEAAWNNVFQVTCWGCKPRSSNYYAPGPVYSYSNPCCDPCQQCTTKYVQRCYYQPVTCYQTKTYYEPVTTYKTSYYLEPVTTYRYSCYYDPCTCSYQQVATPVTSYQVRSQCCPVQSWVQRCCQVPVTTYQKSFYWEPQTTCCTTSIGAPIGQPAVVIPKQSGQPPQVEGKGGSPLYDQYYQQKQEQDQQQSQYRQIAPDGKSISPVKPVIQPPAIKLDKIATGNGTLVEGKVVSDTNAPKGGVQLTFVSAQKTSADKNATANGAGQFNVELSAGTWLVYLRTADGQYIYHSRMEVEQTQKTPVILVSR